MRAEDIMNQNNNRSDAIDQLITFCTDMGFSYSYTEDTFSVTLPSIEPVPTEVERNIVTGNTRKTFRTDTWGPPGVVEGEEPDPEQPLDEGVPPSPQL